jgi:hypothetical protein
MDAEEPDAGRVKRAEVERRIVSVSVISQWSLEALVYSVAEICECVYCNVQGPSLRGVSFGIFVNPTRLARLLKYCDCQTY